MNGRAPKAARRAVVDRTPAGPPECADARADRPLLQDRPLIDADEEYSNDEKLLNEFTKLHPMLSMECTSSRAMQLVASITRKADLKVPEVPVVPKSHDDNFLTRPDTKMGERECCCGNRCLANFIAKVRYGPETDRGFVCKEYLLPSQYRDFLEGKGLPAHREKCLLCCRYFTNYVYILARSDSSFNVSPGTGVQRFANASDGSPDQADIQAAAGSLPTHCSRVSCPDGYKQHAMLFVDEGFADTSAHRTSKLSVLSFRPVVRFCSTHYRYVGAGDQSHIVQVNIGAEDNLQGLGFREPSSRSARARTAAA